MTSKFIARTDVISVAALTAFAASPALADSFKVTVEAGGVQNTSGVFDQLSTQSINSGSFSPGSISSIASAFGGTVGGTPAVTGITGSSVNGNLYLWQTSAGQIANNMTTYAADYGAGYANNGQPLNINLNTGVNYFGVYMIWTNTGNTVDLYNGSNLLYTFNTQDLMAIIGGQSAYQYGPYNNYSAYVNFYDLTGANITKVALSGNYFESNNYAAGQFSNPSSVTGTNILGGVPEPTTWALMLAGFGGLGAGLRRRRRAAMAAA